jgi:hypothetical protein
MTASKGVACGDVACSSILLEALKVPDGTPMRRLLEGVRRLFLTVYRRVYFRLRPGEQHAFPAWRAIMAANFLAGSAFPGRSRI